MTDTRVCKKDEYQILRHPRRGFQNRAYCNCRMTFLFVTAKEGPLACNASEASLGRRTTLRPFDPPYVW